MNQANSSVKEVMNGTLVERLGIEFLEPENGCFRARMPVDHRTVQPMGLLHGGASAALIETLGSTASFMMIDHEREYCVGLEINANHLRPVKSGYVYATAEALHKGRSTHVWDVKIHDEQQKLVCVGRLTVAVRRKPESSPSRS